MEKYLDARIKELEGQLEGLYFLKELNKVAPVQRTVNRWGKEFFYTDAANHLVNQVTIQASCGCCEDAPIFAYFFKEVGGLKVYASPYYVTIGHKEYNHFGCQPTGYWEETLQSMGINTELVKEVAAYLKENPLEPDPDIGEDEW